MTDAEFSKTFQFNLVRYHQFHLTDRTTEPLDTHFVGYLVSGTAEIRTRRRKLLLRAGDVFYMPKGLLYQSLWYPAAGEEVRFYSFGFALFPTEKAYALQTLTPNEEAWQTLRDLCRCVPFREEGAGLLYRLLEQLRPTMTVSHPEKRHRKVEKAVEVMRRDPYVTVGEVAAYCGVSESGLYALFKSTLNETPNRVRRQILCERAKELLSTTDLTVEQISSQLSFSSSSYFRKVFYEHIGKTPREVYREARNI